MAGEFDFRAFGAELFSAAKTAFLDIQRIHAGEHFYSFALYTCGELNYVAPTASTEEGLTRVAEQYICKGYNQGRDLTQEREDLRWSPCDSPLHLELEGETHFEAVNELSMKFGELLHNIPIDDSWDEFETAVGEFIDICIDVLKRLDAEGVFGTGENRNAVTLNVLMGDQSDDERLEYARRLNPPSVYERLLSDLTRPGTMEI